MPENKHILGKVSEISSSIFCFQNKCQIKITTYTDKDAIL